MADPYDPRGDANATPAGTSPLATLARRWPLLAVGLAAGALLGVLIQMSSTRIYQSSALLLVVKKRAETNDNSKERGGAVDDYVGAQITIIKSEQVRRYAAAELRKMPVAEALPEDDGVLAAMIATGLDVVRDRDSAMPGTIGNGIVVVSFKWPNPADAENYLEAVVKAYQNVLTNVYDSSARQQIDLAKKQIEADLVKLKSLSEEKIKFQIMKNRITVEEVSGVRARVTGQKNTKSEVELKLLEVIGNLKLVVETGPNRRDRLAAVAQLTGDSRRPMAESLEQTLRSKKVERESLSKRYGVDHPEMRKLDSEIAFLDSEVAIMNPTDPTGTLDELAAIGRQLQQKQYIYREQIKKLDEVISADEKMLGAVAEIGSKLEAVEALLKVVNDDMAKLDQQVRSGEVAAGSGGYEANAVTPPGFGKQVAPRLTQSILLGLAAGLAMGGAAVGVAELTDRSFKSPAEIRRVLGVPVIGHIPRLLDAEVESTDGIRPSLVTALKPKSMGAEAYRGVRTQLYFSTQGRGHQVIQVTSPNPGDGKSTLASNLAVSIAQSGKSVVLIDCDFRKPQVHKIFNLGKVEIGLSSVVANTATIAKALRRSTVENLDLMPCGERPDNPAELLTHPRFRELLTELRERYDFVVVDTPPMLAVTDPSAVAPQVDGVIVVFRMSKTARPNAEEARNQLTALGANILGVVVNGSTSGTDGYEAYNYGTNYGYRYAAYEYAEGYAESDADAPVGKR